MTTVRGDSQAQRFVVVVFDDRPATTHWAAAGLLAQMYPKVGVRPEQLNIDDGDVLTSGGGAAGMDLA